MNNTPRVTKELLDYLKKVYPNRRPSMQDTDKALWYYEGCLSVIEYINTMYVRQSNNYNDRDDYSDILAEANEGFIRDI